MENDPAKVKGDFPRFQGIFSQPQVIVNRFWKLPRTKFHG